MKTASRKAKGRRLQNKIRDLLIEHFSDELEVDDIRCAIMGESGEDLKLSPAARKLIPYSFECKNQEKLNIWDSLEQAEKIVMITVLFLYLKETEVKFMLY